MQFSAALTKDLGELVSLQIPWAVRQLRRLAAMPVGARTENWNDVWETALPARKSSLITFLGDILEDRDQGRHILGKTPLPPEFRVWHDGVKDELEKYLGQSILPIEVSTAVNQLAAGNTALSLGPKAAPVAAWERQISEIRETMGRFEGQEDNGNFASVLISAVISKGMVLAAAGKREKAIVAYSEALTLADKERDLAQLTMAVNNLSALYSWGAKDINKALQRVLPLWARYEHDPPSLQQARLADALAMAYNLARDPFETQHFLTVSSDVLAQSGFPLSDGADVTEAIALWARLAKERYQNNEPHYVNFLLALSLWINNRYMSGNLAANPEARRELELRMMELQQGYQLVLNIFNDQVREDNELMRSLVGEFEFDPIDPEARDTTEADRKERAIDERLNDRIYNEQLLADIKAEFDRPEVKKDPRLRMQNLWRLGACQRGLGRINLALRHFRQAHHLAEESGGLDDVLFAVQQRVGTLPMEEPVKKLELCLRGIRKMEEARARVQTPYQQSAFVNKRTDLYQMAIAWARYVGKWDTVFGVGDLIKARNFTLPTTDPERMGALRKGLAEHYSELAGDTGEKRIDKLRRRQLFYDNWLLEKESQTAKWSMELPVAELQSALKAGEAVLTYYQLEPEVWLVVLLSSDDLIHAPLLTKPEVLEAQLAALAGLGNAEGTYRARGAEPYVPKMKGEQATSGRLSPKQALHDLAEYLLPLEIVDGLAGADRLYVCPHRQLHRVPFHVLPFEGGYLIEAVAISYLPNLHSLLYKDEEFSCERSVAIIGSGEFTTTDGAQLVNLDGARAEVEELSIYYRERGLEVLDFIDDRATRSALLSTAERDGFFNCDVLQIALHGEDVPTDTPLDARLFVRDGSIDGFDISHWRLSAELVILSACFAGVRAVSGRGLAFLPGDDVFGLQAAFFSAGARRVFGALWPVADEAGKELMLDFHRNLEVSSPARAWQQTVVDLLADGPEAWREVWYWGAFFLVEEGRVLNASPSAMAP